MEETAAGDGGHTDLFHQELRERHVILGELADLRHDVVGTGRDDGPEPGLAQDVQHAIPLALVECRQIDIVLAAHAEGGHRSLLQRRGGADRQKVMRPPDPIGDVEILADGPPHTPAGDAVGLADAIDGDGAFRHPRERRDADVLAAVVQQVLIHLVGDRDDVVLPALLGHELQLRAAEDLAGGVVGSVDDDRFGLRREGVAEICRVEAELGIIQAKRDVPRGGPRQRGIGPVVFVEGLEDDHLVCRIDDGQQRRHHRLGGAAGDGDVQVGIHVDPVVPAELFGNCLAQPRSAPGDGVLIVAFPQRLCRGVEQFTRRVEIGKSLGQVDAVVEIVQAGHFANDRLCEQSDACGRAALRHPHLPEREYDFGIRRWKRGPFPYRL